MFPIRWTCTCGAAGRGRLNLRAAGYHPGAIPIEGAILCAWRAHILGVQRDPTAANADCKVVCRDFDRVRAGIQIHDCGGSAKVLLGVRK